MRSLFAIALLAGCPGSEDSDTFCDGTPVVTWDNFGRGFLTENCQTCHASDSPDRHDAPDYVTFDTEADVAAQVQPILLAATGEAPYMPPEGGVSEDDRFLLKVWLSCYPPE